MRLNVLATAVGLLNKPTRKKPPQQYELLRLQPTFFPCLVLAVLKGAGSPGSPGRHLAVDRTGDLAELRGVGDGTLAQTVLHRPWCCRAEGEEQTENLKQKPALLSAYSSSVALQLKSLGGSRWWDERVERSFAFISGSHCPRRDQRCNVVESGKKKKKTTKQGSEVDTLFLCLVRCLPVSLSERWISNDYLASPHRALPGTRSTVELCPVAVGTDRKKDGVQRQQTMTATLMVFYSRRWPILRPVIFLSNMICKNVQLSLLPWNFVGIKKGKM